MNERPGLDGDVLHLALDRAEAAALVAVLEAITHYGPISTGMLSALGVTTEALALADLAGAKILMEM